VGAVIRDTLTAKSLGPSAGKLHLRLLDSILKLWGAKSVAARLMYWDHWLSRRNHLLQVLCTLWFTISIMANSRNKAILYGSRLSSLSGEINIVRTNLRATAWRLIRNRQVFLAVRTAESSPIRVLAEEHGLDQNLGFGAFMSINALIVLFANSGNRRFVLHFGDSEEAWAALEMHRQGLELARLELARAGADSARLSSFLPEIVGAAEVANGRILVQTRLPGTALSFQHLSVSQLDIALTRAAQAALEFQRLKTSCELGPDHHLIFNVFPTLLRCWPQYEQPLRALLEDLENWQQTRPRLGVLVHGDYWMGNVLFDPASLEVCGIVDWEAARLGGTPGLDAVHFGLMSFAFGKSRPAAHYIAHVMTGSHEEPQLTAYLETVMKAFELTTSDLQHIALIIYFSLLLKQQRRGAAPDDANLSVLLPGLLPVLTQWHAARSLPQAQIAA
jgi:hypothetical protein